jgi:O-antigen/teichoic acid export membrane protein
MFRKIISTIFVRGLLAGLNFTLAIITARYLGPAGKGDVSLFMLNLAIVQLVNCFIGGPYLVYLVPRKNIMQLFLLSYTWSFITAIIIPFVLFFLKLLDGGQVLHLIIISFMFSLFSVNTMVFIGKEEIGKYNISSLLQTIVLIIVFVFCLENLKTVNISSYINAMYFSSGIAFALSFSLVIKYFEKISFKNIGATFYEAIRKGFIVQTGNIAQMFNYRLSFYILDHFHIGGRKEVGIYSVAVSAAEALWLISQSVSLVLYGRISNSNDIRHSRKLTIALIKIVFIITVFCTGILLCLPSSLFVFVFGEGFGEVSKILFPLSAGIVILSAGIIFSSYFAGIGKPQISVIGSVIGLAITIILGFALIPQYGMIGAAITASISYTAGVIYQFYKFMREAEELHFKDFIFSRSDIRLITFEFKNMFQTKQIK